MSSIQIGETNVGVVGHSGIALSSTEANPPAGMLRYFSGTSRFHRKMPAETHFRRRTVRRLNGFVIQDAGREFKVGFVETKDGEERLTQYFVPADFLKHAGVLKENQQFELDEVVAKYRDGSASVTFHVRPSAASNEGFDDPLALDEEHRAKLTELLKKLGDATD